ncbi:MAG: 4-amino-4-deoxychorismate lyase [Sphingobacteriales bacterium 17-39-43]|uniref:aminotransferase class IV n=1 Tax=Daejeonella sp. TaxID=2805397 RepID=UPI000BCE805D|nr:aminotransferase class IV [Daejeonella sp.]OYZ33301.1 MAG: 4-amino-4-deoxychorismate lyase [Sphingobacteriales bacterium 16-39-50]OZA26710.1 MAG: 4-amino-4-deoxychorismate lyase [Sphingobacteriales bacterium 17-39-43]OZA61519.1 MAG: 4-amino-4-deoxychorismate lyase [Sphingobacteriales bacterium 39-40-5]HQS50461.1 aminotransferase class IV [Daejeonella sp.]HQT22314.1 aminotransferase class IV [Daejeonella sp.]
MSVEYINFNGSILPADQLIFKANNRGFRYGDGLFESMRYIKGKLKFPEMHIDRIQKGMKLLRFDNCSLIDTWFLREKVEELVRRNRTGVDARVRLTVFRDSEGLYSPVSNKFGYVLEIQKLDESQYVLNKKGLIIDVYDEIPKPVNALSNLKTCNAMIYVLAGIYKNQNALDEVLILNHHGFLCESMSSNVFVVYDRKLYTPALNEGCIAGVMRQVVMRLAKENDIELVEAQINPDILNEADEVFLTNAGKGIQWVMGYNNKRYFNEVSRFLSEKLNLI